MPLWRIYSNPKTFTSTQRAGLAQNITNIYSSLPPFYVGVLFIDVPEDNMFFSGKPVTNVVRITVEHVARTMPPGDTEEGKKVRRGMMNAVNEVRLLLAV
jgi:phenylpyruvate tautomerase PptA (4-oxalocrotonate tautomerase family)